MTNHRKQKLILYFESVFVFSAPVSSDRRLLKQSSKIPEQCVKGKKTHFAEIIPEIDAVKLYSKYFMSHQYIYLMS